MRLHRNNGRGREAAEGALGRDLLANRFITFFTEEKIILNHQVCDPSPSKTRNSKAPEVGSLPLSRQYVIASGETGESGVENDPAFH
jgi:hypothetical protein